jgi:hypothetical protein
MYVPLLRRIIILVAVLTAVPVIVWTISAFVRAYVGPDKIPTFRQLVTSGEASVNPKSDAAGPAQAAAEQGRLSNSSAAMAEPTATASEARNLPARPNGAAVANPSPDDEVTTLPRAAKMTDASPSPMAAEATDMKAAPLKPDGRDANSGPPAQPPTVQPPAAQPIVARETAVLQAAARQITAQQMAAQQIATQRTTFPPVPPADADSPAQPLTERIPLPRRRPSDLVMAQMTPKNVPMPRPRPEAAGAAASPETTSTGPLDFLHNLFH